VQPLLPRGKRDFIFSDWRGLLTYIATALVLAAVLLIVMLAHAPVR
jgi:hypothetical protein